MKNLPTFEDFIGEGKLELNKTIPTSTKQYTWIYQTGKDSSKTAVDINKKLNGMGIRSFVSRTTGDTIAIPTGDLEKAFDEVISAYDNMKQFAYTDGTKINKKIVNEETLEFGDFLSEGNVRHKLHKEIKGRVLSKPMKYYELESKFRGIDLPEPDDDENSPIWIAIQLKDGSKIGAKKDEFVNEEMAELIDESAKQFSVADFKIGSIVHFKDGEEWLVVQSGLRASNSRKKEDEVMMKPHNKLAKDRNVSLGSDFSLSYLNSNVTKIDKK
jgi:hypothetical protein